MEPKEPFKDWLEHFSKEVEVQKAALPKAKPAPSAAKAQQGFDEWWKREQEPLLKEPEEPVLPAPQAPAAEAGTGELAARVERLLVEKSGLQEQVSRLNGELLPLREAAGRLRAEVASLEAKLGQARESSEGRLAQVQGQLRSYEARLKELQEDKDFLQKNFGRFEDDNSRLQGELKLEREKALLRETQMLELRQKVLDLEGRLSKAREEAAYRAGAAEELKRRDEVRGERLIRAKELTDADVAGLRQDLKLFAEEIKLILRTIRQERAP